MLHQWFYTVWDTFLFLGYTIWVYGEDSVHSLIWSWRSGLDIHILSCARDERSGLPLWPGSSDVRASSHWCTHNSSLVDSLGKHLIEYTCSSKPLGGGCLLYTCDLYGVFCCRYWDLIPPPLFFWIPFVLPVPHIWTYLDFSSLFFLLHPFNFVPINFLLFITYEFIHHLLIV